MNNKYAKAYTEVVELLNALPIDEFNQIPSEEIEFYKENMDKDYNFSIDSGVDLSKQNISFEANSIIIDIFQKYFATEEQKKKIEKILEKNSAEEDALKRERYNPDNIFKKEVSSNIKVEEKIENKNVDVEKNEILPINVKENIFSKIKSFILRIFNKEK